MKVNYKLDRDTAYFFNKCLSSETAIDKYKQGDLMESFTIKLPNKYEVDFKLINGDEDASPWLDVVLFDENGNELACIPEENYCIEGSYFFNEESVGDIEIEITR